MADDRRCRLCAEGAEPFGTSRILGRHAIEYSRCRRCRLVQTEQPYWLQEAYADAISAFDVGLVDRNLRCAAMTRAAITLSFKGAGPFIDYGGGSGLFVRLMRDAGFDFAWQDKFAHNLFARGFVADPEPHGQYELLTAFELFEHLAEPYQEIERMLSFSRSILFSTILLPPGPPQPQDWWYYLPETGQHVALYSKESLAWVASRFGLSLHSDGGEYHLLTDKPVSPYFFRLVRNHRWCRVIRTFSKQTSLTQKDFEELRRMASH